MHPKFLVSLGILYLFRVYANINDLNCNFHEQLVKRISSSVIGFHRYIEAPFDLYFLLVVLFLWGALVFIWDVVSWIQTLLYQSPPISSVHKPPSLRRSSG